MIANILEALKPHAVSIDSLVLDPKNAKTHGRDSIDAIAKVLIRFGQHAPVVFQKTGRIVRKGNGLVTAARSLGWTHIAAIEVDEPDEAAIGRAISDNKVAELSEWDDDVLKELLEGVSENRDLLFDLGFDQTELEELIGAQTSGNVNVKDVDTIPEAPDRAKTRRGDIYKLGNHRLICGDSTSQVDIDLLLAGEVIHLVNMDPPYNVSVEPRSNNAIAAGNTRGDEDGIGKNGSLDLAKRPKLKATDKKLRAKDRPLANDFITAEQFDEKLLLWFGVASRVLVPGRSFYIWGGYSNWENYPRAMAKTGLLFKHGIIWVKEHPVMTRKDFLGNHESCFYGWKEGGSHYFAPNINNAVDTWTVKKLTHTNMVHLTEKPVELAVRAMTYSSRPGENVLDLFGGSGSTLMAAEVTGRRAFLCEIDELYCDVIVKRWEHSTGLKAELLRRAAPTETLDDNQD